MQNPLIAACESLYQEGLSVSAVSLSRIDRGQWRASISINTFMPGAEVGDNLPHHKIALDKKNLPPGVSVTDWTRHPDHVFELRASDEGAEQLIRELAREGQAHDVVCFDGDRWLTKPNKWFRSPVKRG